LVYAQAECDETMVHLDFLYDTGSMSDAETYRQLGESYTLLSKKINKFIQWVEEHFNVPAKPATGNQ
jgi:four helix bundle protein